MLRFAAPDRLVSASALVVDQGASEALFKNSLALLPATERVLIQQADWSEVKNINPYAVFDKPEASLEITPNIGRRGQTGIALIGSNFTPNATNVTVRCDGQVVASNVHADAAGRVTSSFVIPEEARNGNRIVEMTDGVNSAQLGQNGVITSQTYTAGVLLESSNAETWTPLNGSDLTMKIYGYDFQSEGEVRFQPITGVQFSDLNLDEYSSTPEGSAIVWEYSTDGGVTWDAIVPAEEERLPNLAGQVLVRALFSTGAANDSPALNFKDVNLLGFLNNPTGAYLNRENELTQGVASTKVYAQMSIPSGTSINWFASNNGGATWEAMSISATREIDYEWTEYTLIPILQVPEEHTLAYGTADPLADVATQRRFTEQLAQQAPGRARGRLGPRVGRTVGLQRPRILSSGHRPARGFQPRWPKHLYAGSCACSCFRSYLNRMGLYRGPGGSGMGTHLQ